MPAFEHLKKIRASATQTLPILNRNQLYDEPDVGLLFKTGEQFESGGAAFSKKPLAPARFVPHCERRAPGGKTI